MSVIEANFPSDDGMTELMRKRRKTDRPFRQSKKKRSSSPDGPANDSISVGDDCLLLNSGSFPTSCLRASPPADLGFIDGMQIRSDIVNLY